MRFAPKIAAALIVSFSWTAEAWALGEEHFGNAALPTANYTDWPRVVDLVNDPSRVYHSWVNGNEHCFYRGGIAALNAALENFAKVGTEVREVVVRPGPGRTKSFYDKPVEFGWMLHLVGGIARHQTKLDRGTLIWSKFPRLHIFVGEDTQLDQIKVPDGVKLIGLGELKKRNVEALGSSDPTVRGWGSGNLADLDRYDEQGASSIAKLLDDPDDWVRLNAAGALAEFGSRSKAILPALEQAREPRDGPLKEQLQEQVAKAVEAIRNAKADVAEERAHREALRRVEEFLAAQTRKRLPPAGGERAARATPGEADEPWLGPYTGPTRNDIDATTLDGKVLCGYQGWFNTPGDGTDFGFGHWGQGLSRAGSGRFEVDMWPDVSEYDPRDLCEVPGLKMPDGSPARLYSAYRKGPVLLHCEWMRRYGIDGVFLSRFVSETTINTRARHVNTVLASVREGCHREGRVWAMMLDLSMGRLGSMAIVMDDWKFLCDQVKVREDSRYLHHQGKPVVLLWGLGFKDRPWTPEQGEELINFFKHDPRYGGVYLIGGVDPYWRTLRGDSRPDPGWAKVYRMFHAISPWDAGRYRDDAGMDHLRKEVWEGDLAELKGLKIGYMPTAFPGFSWDNLRRTKPGTTMIPRHKGEFYWRQFAIFRALGIRTVFVGMFDEVNEATAIYKVSNQVPVGKYFVNYEGLPSDWYLKLTGAATRMIRGETPLSEKSPFPKGP